MIADNGYKFAYFYDTQGNYSLDFDYEEDFQKIRKYVINAYQILIVE